MLSNLFEKLFNVQEATSHCDIPCGIYDPRDAIQAAQTVVRMTELLEELDFSNGPSASLGNSMARFVAAKEEHAKKAKDDILVIWTDYFKPEHLEKLPNVHDLFWNATKKAGEAKKTEDPAVGEELLGLINEIDEVFQATKS